MADSGELKTAAIGGVNCRGRVISVARLFRGRACCTLVIQDQRRVTGWDRRSTGEGIRMSIRLMTAAAAAAMVLGAGTATAQQYPDRQVRIVVGFAPGGLADQMGRLLGDFITRETGQAAVVENRTGAAGALGADAVAKAAPDGYTIGVVIAGQLIINPHVQKTPPFDVLKDLTPVAAVVDAPQLIAMSTAVPARTVKEFIDLARASPAKFSYGSAGRGSFPHLSAAEFARAANIQMVHVPYRGNAPAITDLIAGRVQIVSSSIASLQAGIDAGKVRVLLSAAKKRLSYLPDVPASPEAGLPDYLMSAWVGVIAPSGTPKPVVERIHGLVDKMLKDAAVKKVMETSKLDPIVSTQAEFAAFVKGEYARWEKILQHAGIEKQ
jgi:tripartite-type tricarboxylate transporter receptor subunit TctC